MCWFLFFISHVLCMLEAEALSWVQNIILSIRLCLLILLFLLSMEVDFLSCPFYIEKVFLKFPTMIEGFFPSFLLVLSILKSWQIHLGLQQLPRYYKTIPCIDPLLIMKYYYLSLEMILALKCSLYLHTQLTKALIIQFLFY